MKTISTLLTVLTFMLVMPSFVLAQEVIPGLEQVDEPIMEISGLPGDPGMPSWEEIDKKMRDEGLLTNFEKMIAENSPRGECFEYYKFPGVQLSLSPSKDEFKPAETIELSGEVTNLSDFPITNGLVFVRVAKTNSDYMTEWHDLIDEFVALEDISLKGGETKELTTKWVVPEGLNSGDYRFDFFFSVGKKYNLGGLPFSNEMIIAEAPFIIVSEKETGLVQFMRAETKVNNEEYRHIGSWPVVEQGSDVLVSQTLYNESDEEKEVVIKNDLYYWDSLNEKDLLDSKSDTIKLGAKEKQELSYTISNINDTVYYLKTTAVSDGIKSIVNTRVVSSLEHARLNYPAITKFPLEKGDELELFSCFHNSSNKEAEGRVELNLFDDKGQKLDGFEYTGAITPAMMFQKKKITADRKLEHLKLEASVYDKNNKIVDSYSVTYDCEDFDSCSPEVLNNEEPVAEEKVETNSAGLLQNYKLVVILFIVAVLLAILGFLVRRNNHGIN